MEFVRLGSTGLKVSRICLGTMTYGSKKWREWVFEEEESRPFIRRALELGVNFFDTADMYSLGASEEIVGRALRDFAASREHVVIATKLFNPMGDAPNQRGLSRKHIRHAIDASLKRLGTDYVDLYQIHRLDHETPMDEIVQGLDDVVRAGKALYVGASSTYAWQFAKMLYIARQLGCARFVSMQNHYNLLNREEEREMLPLCAAEGVGVLPWSPLARGKLTRDWSESTKRGETDEFAQKLYGATADADRRVVEQVAAIAKQRGISRAQVALAWMLGKPVITAPIVGATKLSHLEDAVAALTVGLTAEEIKAMEEPYVPHGVVGFS